MPFFLCFGFKRVQKGTWLFRVKLQVSKYIYIMKLIHELYMSLHITSLTYMHYILILKNPTPKLPCFIPKHRGMELLVTSGFDSTARYAEAISRRNFLTKWKELNRRWWCMTSRWSNQHVEKWRRHRFCLCYSLQLPQIWQRKTKYLFDIYPKTAAWIWMTEKIPNILEDLQLSDGSKKLQHGEPWLNNCLGETMELSWRWRSEEKEGWQKHKTLPHTQV